MTGRSIAMMVAGLTLLVGAPAVWLVTQPAETVGDLDAISQDAAPDTRLPDPPGELTPSELAEDPTPEPEVAPPPAEPVRLSIPAIGVDASVDPVGLEDDGGMEIPHDIHRIGWYEPGVEVGSPTGTAVLSGHVDSREQGEGAFFDLRTMEEGEAINVEHADGDVSEWRVVARTVYTKDELPIDEIFTRFGEPRLALITCGGAFDNTERSYEDNVVVYAEPVDEGNI